jgi:hypothetical protein
MSVADVYSSNVHVAPTFTVQLHSRHRCLHTPRRLAGVDIHSCIHARRILSVDLLEFVKRVLARVGGGEEEYR